MRHDEKGRSRTNTERASAPEPPADEKKGSRNESASSFSSDPHIDTHKRGKSALRLRGRGGIILHGTVPDAPEVPESQIETEENKLPSPGSRGGWVREHPYLPLHLDPRKKTGGATIYVPSRKAGWWWPLPCPEVLFSGVNRNEAEARSHQRRGQRGGLVGK